MTGRSAFVGGIVVGSVVTIAATYFLGPSKSKKKQNERASSRGSIKTREQLLKSGLRGRSTFAMASLAAEGIECGSFLTDILAQLWSHINVAGGIMVKEMMDPTFADMPGPLASVRMTKVDLGKVPIQLDNIVVHKIEDGSLQFDLDVIWDGECDIRFTGSFLSFGVQEVKLKGAMCFLLKPLTNEMPVVSAISYSFINPPDLELDFTGMAQVADFSIVDKSIRKMVQDILASMIVLPNRMLYKMDLACDFLEAYQPPLGMAHVTLLKGRGFKVEKRTLAADDVPDVYANITCGANPNVWRTSTIHNSLAPEWNESANFLLCDHDQIIDINAFDEDKGTLDADDDLGVASISVGDILVAGGSREVELMQKNQRTRAFLTLGCEIRELVPDLSSLETNSDENVLCGLLTMLVTRAFHIPLKKEEAATFVKISYETHEFFTGVVTQCLGVDALNPQYDCAFHVPLSTWKGDIVFTLMNGETVLGTATVTNKELVDAPNKTVTGMRTLGHDGASLEFRVSVRGISATAKDLESIPIAPPTSPDGSEATLPRSPVQSLTTKSIGTVRITAVKGRGFKVQKKLVRKNDIPDIYLNIRFGSNPNVFRTSTVRNSTTPEWNESADFTLSDHGQIVSVHVLDEDKGKIDSDLGTAEIAVGKLLLAGKPVEVEVMMKGKKKNKGTGTFVSLCCEMVDE